MTLDKNHQGCSPTSRTFQTPEMLNCHIVSPTRLVELASALPFPTDSLGTALQPSPLEVLHETELLFSALLFSVKIIARAYLG